jgi:hypothetical protein
MRKLTSLFSALLLCAAAAPARAAAIDATMVLLCVSSRAYDCSAGDTCIETTVEAVNMADILELDPKGKKLTALDAEQRGQASEITAVQETGGRLVVSGADGHRGWKLAVDETSGDSVLTVSDTGVAIVVYGECTPK